MSATRCCLVCGAEPAVQRVRSPDNPARWDNAANDEVCPAVVSAKICVRFPDGSALCRSFARPLSSLRFCSFLQQRHQFIFPQRRDSVTAVPARFVAEGDDDRPATRDTLDLALQNPELWRVDQIIGGIDCQKLRVNFFEVWPGLGIVCSL